MRFPNKTALLLTAVYCTIIPKMNYAQALRFADEIITVRVSENRAIVTGQYLFQNPSQQPLATRLYYPFPLTKDLLYPDSIAVDNMHSEAPLRFSEGPAGIYFPVRIPPEDSIWYQVVYAQHLTGNSFTYILTTTHAWNRPLRSADYIIKMPKKLHLTSISIPVDSTAHKPKYQEYHIHRDNFMPDTDLIIQWEKE